MLYNSFRPKKFNDIIGQDHISTILKNQVKLGQVSHAYLFSGTRGTGKTTSAKILAKAVNCLNPKDGEPCGQCEMCKKIEKGVSMDVIEMDAASHRKIDDVRSIIEKLKYPTAEAKYRVIIFDEVHMLTPEAYNAFLKTLEEPPENTIFILATTDPQKLPVTILSRCQRFDFRRIKPKDIFSRLQYVCKESSIQVDLEGLKLIAKVSDGAMRDALSLLDQVKSISLGKISYEQVLDQLGTTSQDSMFKISSAILSGNTIDALNIIDGIDTEGKNFDIYTKDLIKFLRHILMVKSMGASANAVIPMAKESIERLNKIATGTTKENIIFGIRNLQEAEVTMRNTSQIRVTLELAVIQITTSIKQKPIEQLPDRTGKDINPNNDKSSPDKNDNSQKLFKTEAEKLLESKKNIIKTLKEDKLQKLKYLGVALENSKMKLSPELEIKIEPKNEKDKKIITIDKKVIIKGFAKFLDRSEDSIKILIA